jgi:hypothetical protein
LTSTLQTSDNQGLEDSSDVGLDEKPVPVTTNASTDQLSGENVSIPPVSDQADPENAAELF